ncbi:hypothetical protein AgCh_038542 [Apium graveolens]
MGCSSTLDVLNPHSSSIKPKPKPKPQPSSDLISKKQEKAEKSSLLRQISMKKKNSTRDDESFGKASSYNIAGGIHKLIQKSSKTFSQVFVSKYEEDEEDEEEELVIGAPTNVEHLTHIGIGQFNSSSLNNISLP